MGSANGEDGKHAWLFDVCIFLLGGALLGLCVYLTWDSIDLYIKNITIPGAPDKILWAIAVCFGLASGALCLVVCLMGCCGARLGTGCALNTYLGLVVICIILEISATVLAVLFSHQIPPGSESQYQTSIQDDYINPNATSSSNPSTSYTWNIVQSEWQCCGSESYTDYWYSNFTMTTNLTVPYECCTRKPGVPTSDLSEANVINYTACQMEATTINGPYTYLYSEGCYKKTTTWITSHSNYLLGTAFSEAFLQGFWLALLFCFALPRDDEMVNPALLTEYVINERL